MNRKQFAGRVQIALQLLVLFVVMFTLHYLDYWGIIPGITYAQASLLGLFLGVGPIHRATRFFWAVVLGTLFAFLCAALVFKMDISLELGRVNLWDLLLLMVRVIVIGGVCWRAFGREGYVMSLSGTAITHSLLRFRISLFLVLTFLLSLYFAAKYNNEHSAERFWLVLLIVLRGCAYSAMSFLACLLVLEPVRRPRIQITYLVGILTISIIVASHWYDSWTPWASAKRAWYMAIVEAAWVAGSLLALRITGYRLAKHDRLGATQALPSATPRSDETA